MKPQMESPQLSNRFEHSLATANALIEKIRDTDKRGRLRMNLPSEIQKIGFRRVLVSRIEKLNWIVEAAYSENGLKETDAILRIGQSKPYQNISSLYEAEAVLKGRAILRSAQHDPKKVHPRLHKVINSKVYVAAPIVANGVIIGLIHADENSWTGSVDDFDKDLLGLIAHSLGLAIEYQYSLRDFLHPSAEEHGLPFPDDLLKQSQLSKILTSREIEVARHMAQGKTNKQISAILFISEYTVKTHVQNILHKLGASNRSEAAYVIRTLSPSLPKNIREAANA